MQAGLSRVQAVETALTLPSCVCGCSRKGKGVERINLPTHAWLAYYHDIFHTLLNVSWGMYQGRLQGVAVPGEASGSLPSIMACSRSHGHCVSLHLQMPRHRFLVVFFVIYLFQVRAGQQSHPSSSDRAHAAGHAHAPVPGSNLA